MLKKIALLKEKKILCSKTENLNGLSILRKFIWTDLTIRSVLMVQIREGIQ